MDKEKITLGFLNGLNFNDFCREVLWIVSDVFDFEESNQPDFVIFGPYGHRIPKGKYTRIGYYCENIIPDLKSCEWAFGMRYQEDVASSNYMQIAWHGLTPNLLQNAPDFNAAINPFQRDFANYIYSQQHSHRENLFRALNDYRRVDAPGRSMRNMPPFDDYIQGESMWIRKRNFIKRYKFTLAIENYSSQGYHTEKLTDPLIAGSVPIYFGNPSVSRIFNKDCFINAYDYLSNCSSEISNFWDLLSLERFGRKESISDRYNKAIRRRLRSLKMFLLSKHSFDNLVEIVEQIDNDENRYMAMLKAPRMTAEAWESYEDLRKYWIKIFSK